MCLFFCLHVGGVLTFKILKVKKNEKIFISIDPFFLKPKITLNNHIVSSTSSWFNINYKFDNFNFSEM